MKIISTLKTTNSLPINHLNFPKSINPLIQKTISSTITYSNCLCLRFTKKSNNFSFKKKYSEKNIAVFCLPIDELKNKQIIHDVNFDCYAERSKKCMKNKIVLDWVE